MADRTAARSKPHTYSMVAAAEVLTSRGVRQKVTGESMLPWQERAWGYYDNVGEFRFGVNWLSNGLSRVNLTAARPPAQVGDEPVALRTDSDTEELTPVEVRSAELVSFIAGGASGQGQLMAQFGDHLSIAGFGWLVAEPDLDNPDADTYESWDVLAQDSIKIEGSKDNPVIKIRTASANSQDAWRLAHPNALIVKTWRQHPRRPWEPDAPVRGVLGVLDQIDLLSAHVTASGRSRLAGAGILAVPSEAQFPPPPDADPDDLEQDTFDRFVDNLVETMTVPIKDRDSAAGVVPLVIQIPGEYLDKLKHITFSTPFDAQVRDLLSDAIKRLALGMDMPPEVLTGMAGVNHWTAWQVEETAITLHIEPNAEIVCQALTEGYLRPALEAEGYDPAGAMVWYDTSSLTAPPDRSSNVVQAYDRLQASGSALRSHLGLAEDDKPDDQEFRQRVLLDAAKGAPTLAPVMLAEAGLLDPQVGDAVEDVQAPDGGSPSTPDDEATGADGPPPASDRPSGDRAASVDALIMAADGVVFRAMERAGAKLKSAVGRKVTGGPQAVEHSEATTLHTVYDATLYTDLDHLLAGAFDRVPELASDLDIDPDALQATLRAYCRSLLAAGHEHERIRLINALGVEATL